MNINANLISLIGQPESELLEYKAVLPPARTLAVLIAGFANTKGGLIVLGVQEKNRTIEIHGLSEDFRATSVTHKAYDLLSPQPSIKYESITHQEKRLFVIEVEKSSTTILFENRIYRRENIETKRTSSENTLEVITHPSTVKISGCQNKIEVARNSATESRNKFLDHYQGILNILETSRNVLAPVSASTITKSPEGKILMRILFSSCADSFEMFLSDLMYEIYLAKPDTLKSGENQVLVREVLECADMQEFVIFWSRKKLSKLQRGSIKGFLDDNEHIRKLNAIDKNTQQQIENLMEVRHLYSHRNGVVDDKFLKSHSGSFAINQEHQYSLDTFIDNMEFFINCVLNFDKAAIAKFNLSTIDKS